MASHAEARMRLVRCVHANGVHSGTPFMEDSEGTRSARTTARQRGCDAKAQQDHTRLGHGSQVVALAFVNAGQTLYAVAAVSAAIVGTVTALVRLSAAGVAAWIRAAGITA